MEDIKAMSLYNSQIEIAIRIAKILMVYSPIALSIEKIICIDFIVLNLKDFIPNQDSLHPAVPRRDTQLAITRKTFTESLDFMKNCRIVKEAFTNDGIVFMVTDKTFSFTNAIHNEYILKMEKNILVTKESYGSLNFSDMKKLVASKFGKLDMEIHYEPLF
jgi:hypothetical protein